MFRNKIINRNYLTEGQVQELLTALRTDPSLNGHKWIVTINRQSTMIVVEGPNKGASEKGQVIDLAYGDERKVLWITETTSILK